MFFSFLCESAPYKLRLTKEEKENIKLAYNSGSKFYALKKNSLVFDMITNTKWHLEKPIIARFFNSPTLSGERYMSTNGKIRYIVPVQFLNEAEQVTQMRPEPEDFIEVTTPLPLIPVGAPHEN